MIETKVLVKHLNASVMFDYVDHNRVLSRRDVVVNRIEEGETAGGKYRIWIHAFDKNDNIKQHKTFLAHRILTFIDSDTGECHKDIEQYFTKWISKFGGEAALFWPKPENNKIRIRNFDLEFDDDGFLFDWVFGVHTAFRPALDILWTSGKSENGKKEQFWTRGYPPQFDFDIGDIFYAPKCIPNKWIVQSQKIHISIIVLGFAKSSGSGEQVIVVQKNEYRNGKIINSTDFEVTQYELAKLLRCGVS